MLATTKTANMARFSRHFVITPPGFTSTFGVALPSLRVAKPTSFSIGVACCAAGRSRPSAGQHRSQPENHRRTSHHARLLPAAQRRR